MGIHGKLYDIYLWRRASAEREFSRRSSPHYSDSSAWHPLALRHFLATYLSGVICVGLSIIAFCTETGGSLSFLPFFCLLSLSLLSLSLSLSLSPELQENRKGERERGRGGWRKERRPVWKKTKKKKRQRRRVREGTPSLPWTVLPDFLMQNNGTKTAWQISFFFLDKICDFNSCIIHFCLVIKDRCAAFFFLEPSGSAALPVYIIPDVVFAPATQKELKRRENEMAKGGRRKEPPFNQEYQPGFQDLPRKSVSTNMFFFTVKPS